MRNTWIEPVAVFALIELTIWKLYFWFKPIPLVVIALVLVLAVRRARGDVLRSLGIQPERFSAAWGWAALAVAVNSYVFILLSPEVCSWLWPAAFIPPILKQAPWYFVKAMAQQVPVQGYFTAQLHKLIRRDWLAALVSGALFSAAHAPNPFLMVVCGLNGVWSAWVFMRKRNIWPIAAAHALVASAALVLFPEHWHHTLRIGSAFWHHICPTR